MDAKKFGCFIAEQRKSLGLTQAAVAEQLHVTNKAVSRWERGRGFPDIHLIEPLADALEVSIAEIMTGEKRTADDGCASSAAKNVICMAQRKREEYRNLFLVTGVAALVLFCILLIDIMGLMGFVGVVLPCFGLTAGITLTCTAVMRRKRRLPFGVVTLWAAILTAIPLIFAILFFLAGMFGPVPG